MPLPPIKYAPSSYEAHPPLPPGLEYGVHFTRTEGLLRGPSGHQLWYAVFWPTQRPFKGLVLFCHGLHEHSERYHHVLPQAAARGYVAVAHDHLGHGRSEGLRGHVERFDDFVEDAEAVLALVQAQVAESVPTFVWGQSMGGLIAAHLALRDSRKGSSSRLAGVVVQSGAIDVPRTVVIRVQVLLAPIIIRMIPKVPVTPIRPEVMSSDKAEVKRWFEDPNCSSKSKVRVKLGFEVLAAGQRIMEGAKELRTPLLAIHGTADECTYPPGAQSLVQKAASTDKEFVPVQGALHCLVHDRCAPEVMARVLAFFDRLAAQGTQAPGSAATLRSRL